MDKPRMESMDVTAQNIGKIGALFPNCITETKDADGKPKKAINFDLLRQMVSDDVLEGDEAYKKAAIEEANKPIRKTLRPCPEESVNWGSTENLYIEGDKGVSAQTPAGELSRQDGDDRYRNENTEIDTAKQYAPSM